MPTLTQLTYIVAVEKFGHFGKAAEHCHVSQPSLSIQIQKVEDEMAVIIFDRGKKPVIATEKGAVFIAQAKIILRESHKLSELVKQEKAEVSGEFHLGIIPTIAPYLLPLFIEDFSRSYPKVQLKIDEMKTSAIVSALQNDELDGGILATPLGEKGLRERVLFYEDFFLLAGAESSLAERRRIKETDLDGSEMWLLQDGHCLRQQVVKVCSLQNTTGVFKNIRFEGGNLETLRYLVKKSRGYTLVPRLFVDTLSEAERRNHIKEFERPIPSREVSLLYRRDQWKVDTLQALETVIVRHLPKDLKRKLDANRSEVIPL